MIIYADQLAAALNAVADKDHEAHQPYLDLEELTDAVIDGRFNLETLAAELTRLVQG